LTQDTNFKQQTKELIDSLKAVCAGAGLGNTAGEFNIILQSFLYKFLNDKFSHEVKKMRPELAEAEKIPDVEHKT
jgi:type I restriction enzyme M protein